MTYNQATSKLPQDAEISCTFGTAGVGGYNEYYRTPDGARWVISNGKYDAVQLDWACERI